MESETSNQANIIFSFCLYHCGSHSNWPIILLFVYFFCLMEKLMDSKNKTLFDFLSELLRVTWTHLHFTWQKLFDEADDVADLPWMPALDVSINFYSLMHKSDDTSCP